MLKKAQLQKAYFAKCLKNPLTLCLAMTILKDVEPEHIEINKQTEAERIAYLHELVEVGTKEIREGKGIAYKPELMNQLAANAIANLKAGKPISNVVKP